MEKRYFTVPALIVLLALTIFMAGCSGPSSTPAAQPEVTGTAPTAASTVPLYTAGDIVKNPKSTSAIGVLIISYNADTDMYTRALVYPNSDGSWGYRMDSTTESVSRATIEKLYTTKVTNKAVSSIQIGAPAKTATTAPGTTMNALTTVSGTGTTASTTTSVSTGNPSVSDITPDSGYTGTSVAITQLKGYNFADGATVQLVKSGSTSIPATSVSVVSVSDITCTFTIPSNATVGSWDVVVTNQNGYVGTYAHGFLVRQGSTTSMTTTTSASSTSTGIITVTGISPSSVYSGYQSFTITGTNFASGATATLKNSNYGFIQNSAIGDHTSTSMIVFFNIPASPGTWDVVVTNPDNTYGTLAGGVTIHQ
jgi:hypothetical protein